MSTVADMTLEEVARVVAGECCWDPANIRHLEVVVVVWLRQGKAPAAIVAGVARGAEDGTWDG